MELGVYSQLCLKTVILYLESPRGDAAKYTFQMWKARGQGVRRNLKRSPKPALCSQVATAHTPSLPASSLQHQEAGGSANNFTLPTSGKVALIVSTVVLIASVPCLSLLCLLKAILSTSALECPPPSALGGQSCHLRETLGLPDRDLGKNEQEKRTPEVCESQAGGPWGSTLESSCSLQEQWVGDAKGKMWEVLGPLFPIHRAFEKYKQRTWFILKLLLIAWTVFFQP